MKYLSVLLIVLIMGCGKSSDDPTYRTVDQCLRREIFNECMSRVPKGPTHTAASNDWADNSKGTEMSDKMREDFERAMSTTYPGYKFKLFNDIGLYFDPYLEAAWQGWKACHAQSQQGEDYE